MEGHTDTTARESLHSLPGSPIGAWSETRSGQGLMGQQGCRSPDVPEKSLGDSPEMTVPSVTSSKSGLNIKTPARKVSETNPTSSSGRIKSRKLDVS